MASFVENFGQAAKDYMKSIPKGVLNLTADLLENGDFISRTIGTNKSYNDIMFMIQSLGREPISLLGKDYIFIYDHVRRNYLQGTQVMNMNYDVPKFTFYKEKPTIRFADVDNDPLNLIDRWFPKVGITPTMAGDGTEAFYAESFDGLTNNKAIQSHITNEGIAHGGVASFGNLSTRDLLRKTNENFRHGKYETLVARFHTNAEPSKATNDLAQTANTKKYGLSHGRNLLKLTPSNENSYDNPYCRVWTYHHQYDRMTKAIRPFIEGVESQEELESMERVGDYETVGFRTKDIKSVAFTEALTDGNGNAVSTDLSIGKSSNNLLGGSKLLDKYGVLNSKTGFVNIAPTAKIVDYFFDKEDDYERKSVSTKRCMFSIENLAWKSVGTNNNEYSNIGLSPEQRGPLGGRIMWFPPYDINFSEESRVEWNGNQFIGRGEKIYTYTNTERTGSLSFTLLIDHPSILDYWNGHERNGMKNQGMTLAPGNSGGVDRIDNQENTLLRFFAGCEVLSAKPQEFWKAKEEVKQDTGTPQVQQEEVTTTPETPEVTTPKTKTICCCLFFPNNYSGVDDFPTVKSSKFNAINYLMNGFGTGKFINTQDEDCLMPVDGGILISEPISDWIYECDVTANTTECYKQHSRNDCSEWPCHENGLITNPQKVSDFSGGYEVHYNEYRGISVSKELINQANINKSYACTGRGVRGRFITNGDGSKRYARKVMAEDPEEDIFLNYFELAKINGPSPRYSWYYRIDSAYHMQKLSKDPTSYLDLKSFGYNGKNFFSARTINEFDIKEDTSDYKLISFVDMFCALETEQKCLTPISQENVNIIRDIMTKDNIKVKSIKLKGHASKQGHSSLNTDLANHRAETLKQWLIEKGFKGAENGEVGDPVKQDTKSNPNMGGDNTELAKLWRSAEMVIEYEVENVENVQVSQPSSPNRVNWSSDAFPISGSGDPFLDFLQESEAEQLAEKAATTEKEKIGEFDFNPETMTKDTVNRYDNEGEFFELLEKNSPFMHHLITDKIKYFDPAFHSISPEGFNARLTFLHQCTRQGSTAENSNFETSSAYNLAFGRPPVCVLRLGDFYYTKIIINSLSIQYETPQWDLNPEGIGVMPMFAKINLTFAFIGGSDLAGPIARLQNAVSFNYYANTSVYDNRADRVEYDPDKTGKEIKYRPIDFLS